MESFSTYGVPPDRKVSFWNELSSDAFAAMEIAPRDAQAFDGRLRREFLGSLTLMDVHSGAVRIRRTRSHIVRAHEASWLLVAPLVQSMQLSMEGGSPIHVAAGQFCLLDHARPWEIEHGDAMRTLCVDIPRGMLQAEIDAAEQLAGRLMRADSPGSRLLVALLQALSAEFNDSSQLMLPPATASGLWSLIVAAYSVEPAREAPTTAAARVTAVHAEIDARLSDPGLCPAQIAARRGFSERYLRRLMQSAGESFSAYLLRRRLELAGRLLRDPSLRQQTVTSLAYRAGFSDATHFGRVFRARYGATPRDYRASCERIQPSVR